MPKTIALTRGQVTVVDDADYELLIQHKWHCTANGYAAGVVNKVHWYMHRFLLRPPQGKVIDHIDGDGLNNVRSNLRIVTPMQNSWNRHPRQVYMSGFKGVAWHQHANKWQVRIGFNHKRYFIGYFDDVEDAARAYDAAARHYFGKMACCNFPEELGTEES